MTLAVAGGVAGAIALAGWLLPADGLKSILPGLPAVRMSTAFTSIVASASLLALPRPRLARMLGVTVGLIGVLALAHYLVDLSVGVDDLLQQDSERMAPSSALCFSLLGLSVFLLAGEAVVAGQLLAVLVLWLSILAVCSLVYGSTVSYGVALYARMTVQAAVILGILAMGALLSRPTEGLMAVISSESAGGLMARRLLPAAFALPLLLGALSLVGHRWELYDSEFRLAFTVMSSIVFFTSFIWANARSLEDMDRVRRRAEDEVRTLNAELEQRVVQRTAELTAANKELEAFSYSVSHDLRTPLRSIDGYSQLLLEDHGDTLDAEGREHLQRVRAASQRMARLIDDMLRLARVTRAEMRRERVDLSAMARAVEAELRRRQPDRQGVRVSIQDGMSAEGDPVLLRAVLENLMGNAWKFTSQHDRALIEVSRSSAGFFVRDDGAGFDMAYADKLFNAFERLHPTPEFEGSGVGLATVKRIIDRHGGRIWAEAAVEQGAKFNFTLEEPWPGS